MHAHISHAQAMHAHPHQPRTGHACTPTSATHRPCMHTHISHAQAIYAHPHQPRTGHACTPTSATHGAEEGMNIRNALHLPGSFVEVRLVLGARRAFIHRVPAISDKRVVWQGQRKGGGGQQQAALWSTRAGQAGAYVRCWGSSAVEPLTSCGESCCGAESAPAVHGLRFRFLG